MTEDPFTTGPSERDYQCTNVGIPILARTGRRVRAPTRTLFRGVSRDSAYGRRTEN